MSISGWYKKYNEILEEFNYEKDDEIKSATLLNSILKYKFPINKLRSLIEDRVVFVIGAGPSVSSALVVLKKFGATKITADGATKLLVENNITPDIVVTDLDGCEGYIEKINNEKTIIIVHAHGDNYNRLKLVTKLKNCVGTTEGIPFGNIHNFGGFTDGDRCVFLASYFNAKKIVLLGMDFGNKIGRYSKNIILNKNMKIKKMKKAKILLEWLASKKKMKFYTTSNKIKGFEKISYNDIQYIV